MLNLNLNITEIFNLRKQDDFNFELPQYKPEYFYTGDRVLNVETGQVATIFDIVSDPMAGYDGDFAYVCGNGWSDYWTYDEMELYTVSFSEVQ